jgi:transposase-like protein
MGNQSFDKMRRNGGQVQRLPKGVYCPEFRDEAVRLHLENNLTITEIANRLSLPKGTLKNWVAAVRQGKPGEVGKSHKSLSDLELELARLKRELAEVKMERELLNNAHSLLREDISVKVGRIKEYPGGINGGKIIR